MSAPTRTTQRRQLRAARRSLSRAQQRLASQALLHRLAQHPLFVRSRHVAFYLAVDGEIDPSPLLELAQRRGKACYVPVLSRWPATHMRFQRLHTAQRWRRNRFGIAEPVPDARHQIPAWRLNLVLMPLVGFDATGNRLGMGGGFYDRTFAYRARRDRWKGPRLFGLAHDCQKVAGLTSASWDIALDAIVTDRELIATDQQA